MKKYGIGKFLFLSFIALISLYPFYWLAVGSTLTSSEIFKLPPRIFFGKNLLVNYENLVNLQPIWSAFKNSLLISSIYTICTVYLSSLAGYTFAKYEFRFKKILFGIILLTMMLPGQVTLIPLFKIIIKLGWLNKPQAIIVPALANAFGVFFMRQNMINIPTELIESGRVDGASEMYIFHRIILPISLPALAALGILNFISQWGNFLWPLITLQEKNAITLPVLLSQMVVRGEVVDYGAVLLGAVISVLPIFILFLFLQKYFISGIYGGAVKG